MSTESSSNDKYQVKKLDNQGLNYSTWAVRCQSVLEDLNVWSVVNPTLSTSTPPAPPSTSLSGKLPSSEPSDPAEAEWHKKNSKVQTVIFLSIEDTPIQIVKMKCLARDIWKTLADQYTGVGALDALILMSCLHHFQLDDSKPLESQINQMSDMRSQLATMGDEISDAKFAIIISGALPSSYDTLKTMAIASVTDMSQLMSDTLIQQILREEKCKGNQDSAADYWPNNRKPQISPLV